MLPTTYDGYIYLGYVAASMQKAECHEITSNLQMTRHRGQVW